jgi:hypothetical protein
MSAGTPTTLVRDAGIESYDDSPDEEPSQAATMIIDEPPPGTDVLSGADDAERQPTSGEIANAAVFGALSTWHRHPNDPHEHR